MTPTLLPSEGKRKFDSNGVPIGSDVLARCRQRIDSIVENTGFDSFYGKHAADEARRSLGRFEESTLELIERVSLSNASKGHPHFKFMLHVITALDERDTREVMFFFPHYLGDIDTEEAIGYVKGLRILDRFKDVPRLEELTGKDFTTAVAFLNITATMDEDVTCEYLENDHVESDIPSVYINDKALHDLIVEHYEKAEQIRRFIWDRRITDPAVIREHLSSHSSLSSGTL